MAGTNDLDDAYNRGVEAGIVKLRLDGHDEHLKRINGSMDKVAEALKALAGEVHDARGELAIRDANAVAITAALAHKAEETAHKAEEAAKATTSKWSLRERWMGVVLFLVALLGVVSPLIGKL